MNEKLDPENIGKQQIEMGEVGSADPGDGDEPEFEVTEVRMGDDHIKTAIELSEESSLPASMGGVAATMAEGYKGTGKNPNEEVGTGVLEPLPEDPETSFNKKPGEGMGGVGSKMAEKPQQG